MASYVTAPSVGKQVDDGGVTGTGSSALQLASQGGHLGIVRALLASGANVNLDNVSAAMRRVLLLWAGCSVELWVGVWELLVKDRHWGMRGWGLGSGVLGAGCEGAGVGIIRLLLPPIFTLWTSSISPRCTALLCTLALLWDSSHGRVACVCACLPHGQSLHDTALCFASQEGHLEVVEALLAAGAVVNPLEVCQQCITPPLSVPMSVLCRFSSFVFEPSLVSPPLHGRSMRCSLRLHLLCC
jgi:hypothetical protein